MALDIEDINTDNSNRDTNIVDTDVTGTKHGIANNTNGNVASTNEEGRNLEPPSGINTARGYF